MKLCDLFEKGKFVVTGEAAPPKGTNTAKMLSEAAPLKDMVDAVNITDNQSAVVKMGSLAASRCLKDNGIEPVYQLTCRDRNRLAIQSDLLSAAALGIENVLCLTGDHVSLGDHPHAKAVYDLDSVQLLKIASGLNHGKDSSGNELDGSTDFCLGAVVSPCTEPVEMQVIKLEKKIEAGACFIQTQAVYDTRLLEDFMNRLARRNITVPVMVGIVFIKSASMANYMNKNVAGIEVPETIIKEFENTPGDGLKAKSLEITIELVNAYKDMCQGIHFMPLGWTDMVPEVLKNTGLRT